MEGRVLLVADAEVNWRGMEAKRRSVSGRAVDLSWDKGRR
jgi:hypothetical protein